MGDGEESGMQSERALHLGRIETQFISSWHTMLEALFPKTTTVRHVKAWHS